MTEHESSEQKIHRDKTILVTEDDKDIAQFIKSALEMEGYHVICVQDGVKAVEIVQNQQVHLIILDIMMPVFSGYWFCDVFKKNPQTKDIPVIFISALNSDEDIKRGMELGASAYLTKPFKIKKLLDTVASLF
ncbi:MAG: response regulator [Candidatus Auribacterota bacterium]|jgi:DNA-binding response OmpR family regulator|nr:response regulator [Candidatus Auribacterota bacterium]